LPPEGCKLHRLFHSSMPEFSVTPIHHKTREVQFVTGGDKLHGLFYSSERTPIKSHNIQFFEIQFFEIHSQVH